MKKYFIMSIPFFAALFLTSCESIPPGTAPEGAIVKFTAVSDQKPVNSKTAVNIMITSLITSPIISSAEGPPIVFYKTSPLNLDKDPNKDNSFRFNSNALKVYKNLLYSNLINSPISLDDYDYYLNSFYQENYIFRNQKEGNVIQWTLLLYSKNNSNHAVWKYSVNVLVPKKENKKKSTK